MAHEVCLQITSDSLVVILVLGAEYSIKNRRKYCKETFSPVILVCLSPIGLTDTLTQEYTELPRVLTGDCIW